MRNWLKTLGLSWLLIAPLAVWAAEAPLFKSYQYGQQRSLYAHNPSYYDCEDELDPQALCTYPVPFIGHEFMAKLQFSEQRLVNVMLIADYTDDLYLDALVALNKNFSLVAMQDEAERLDLLEFIRQVNERSEFEAKVEAFESVALDNGQISYLFLEGRDEVVYKHRNSTAAVNNLPVGTRSAELNVFYDEDGDYYFSINFSQPLLWEGFLEKKLARDVEDF